MNLYQHAKNEAVSLICSGHSSDWLRAFWPISQEQKLCVNMIFVEEHIK